MNDRDKYKAVFSQIHTCVKIDLADYQTAGKPKHLARKRFVLAAAIICFILASSMAAIAANYWFGLKNLMLPAPTPTPVLLDTNSPNSLDSSDLQPILEPPNQSMTFISLQGYAGSPEYQALVEWNDFCASYDSDRSIMTGIGNSDTGLGNTYFLYGCYTQEMADKLDEIADKYGLSLHGEFIYAVNVEEFMANIANGSFLGFPLVAYPGYWYEDGTFQFEGEIADNEPYGVTSPYDFSRIAFEFRSSRKGSMDYVALNIGNFYGYTEWAYETACGVTVCLAQNDGKSLIIADLDNAFVVVNVLAGSPDSGGKNLSGSALEAFADAIDFTLLK